MKYWKKAGLNINKNGQSMVEYILIIFLIVIISLGAVQLFGKALDLAFLQAIDNITVNMK